MRRTMATGLFLLSLSFSTPAWPETLSLQQAVVMGLGHNYALRASALDQESAAAGVLGAQARFDVSVEVAAGTGRSETPLASASMSGAMLSNTTSNAEAVLRKRFPSGLTTRLGLEWTRTDADSLADRLDPAYRTSLTLDLIQPLLKDRGTAVNTADLRMAQARRAQAACSHLAQAQQLVAEIEQAYLSLAQAQEDARAARFAQDLARELLTGNQRKLDAGMIAVSEVSEARAALAGREEAVLQVAQREADALNRLLALIDQDDAPLPPQWQAELPGPGEEPEPPLEEMLASGLAQRPELQQARLEITAREIAVVYTENQRLPRLDLEASLGVNGLSGDDDGSDSRYSGGWQEAFGRAAETDGSSWYAGLRFSLPLQNRAARAGWRDALAQARQALYRLYNAESVVDKAIRSAHAMLTLGRTRLEVARRSTELARTSLEQETRRLQEGLSDTFRVLAFQDALVAARLREVSARVDYQRSLANLYQAAGANLARYDIHAALPREGALP